MCVCVSLPPRLLITNDVMWHDKDPYMISELSTIANAFLWQL